MPYGKSGTGLLQYAFITKKIFSVLISRLIWLQGTQREGDWETTSCGKLEAGTKCCDQEGHDRDARRPA